MPWILLLLSTLPAAAAVADLSVVGTTSTQIVLSYTAPSEAGCTVEASKLAGYTPLAADVDPVIYAGSNLDSRIGSISQGRERIFVIGRQGPAAIEAGTDGYRRSRSLQADTTYYIRVTCGADTATIAARTANIFLGDSRGEALAVSSAAPFEYDGVAANAAALPELADPYTGALIKRAVGLSFGFGGSTATNGHGDCNRTLSEVKGSCLFADAAGTGWTATTGTLTDAVRGNDTNYAEYSGSTQQPLFIRLGTGKVPSSSTPEEIGGLAFQNIIIRGLASAGTEAIDLCWVEDVTVSSSPCISPLRQVNLTTSEATIRICKDAPCSAADSPGDIMFDKYPSYYSMYPNTRVYNVAGDFFSWRFTGSKAQETCDGIYTGQYLYTLDSRSYSVRTGLVTAKSCGSSPPRVTVTLDYDLTHNGTTGVTLFRLSDFANSPNVGIRIRKVSTSSGATVKIGYALWRAAVGTPLSFALGSGGFGKRCQTIPLPSGEYLCHFSGHLVGVSYGAEGLTLKNYGFVYIRTNYLGVGGLQDSYTSYNCIGSGATNDSMWSDTVPGRFYCVLPSSYHNPALGYVDNRVVVVELNLDTSAEKAVGDPDAVGSPGLSNKAQRTTFTATRVITPCLNTCSSTSDDYTLYGQFKRFNSNWDGAVFNRVGLASVQGNLLFLTAYSGSQDSHGWIFAMDLGNGQPIGGGYTGAYGNTQHVFAGFFMSASQACRWCAVHTYQGPLEQGGAKFTVVETGAKCPLEFTGLTTMGGCSIQNNNCSPCPNVALDGYNYGGKNWCGMLDITSSWNGAWGSTPAGFAAGDPIAPNGCSNGAPNVRYWGQKLEVGDWITSNNEYARIIAKSGNTLTLIRGWGGYFDGFWNPKAHSNGDTWYTTCGAYPRNPEGRVDLYLPGAAAWWPTYDPTGSDPAYTYYDDYQNHALHTGTLALRPEYPVVTFMKDSPASLRNPTYSEAGLAMKWAGAAIGSCSGNACEKHPAYGQVAGTASVKTWFADVHPRLSHASNGKNAVALVAGKTYIYKWQGQAAINPRLFDIEAYTAFWPFRRVDTLADSASESGKWCWAVAANDCFAGSTANGIYWVNEAFDTTFIGTTENTCRVAEFGSLNGDVCFGNTGGISASTTQWKIPSRGEKSLNGSGMRVVSKFARSYREAATENVKVDPLGKVLFARGGYYVMPPAFPGRDSRSQATFAAIQVEIPTVPAGTATAIVEFGYNGNFQCSRNRDESCIADKALLDEAMPYKFSHETIAGVPCTSSCSVTIPALHSRVLYYRTKYRDGTGATIATDLPKAMVVH